MTALVRVNQRELERVASGAGMDSALQSVGDRVAERAARSAPKRSGEGARSIRAETGEDDKGAFVRVSWDRDHFYMGFIELGTSRLSARPFLRPALHSSYDI